MGSYHGKYGLNDIDEISRNTRVNYYKEQGVGGEAKFNSKVWVGALEAKLARLSPWVLPTPLLSQVDKCPFCEGGDKDLQLLTRHGGSLHEELEPIYLI